MTRMRRPSIPLSIRRTVDLAPKTIPPRLSRHWYVYVVPGEVFPRRAVRRAPTLGVPEMLTLGSLGTRSVADDVLDFLAYPVALAVTFTVRVFPSCASLMR